jgi:hypothetical protein
MVRSTTDKSDEADTDMLSVGPKTQPKAILNKSMTPNRKRAAEFGLSERQLYRLQTCKPASDLHPTDVTGVRLSAKLLNALGHGDLVATDAQAFLHIFIVELVNGIKEQLMNANEPIDPQWAKANAQTALNQLCAAAKRRRAIRHELTQGLFHDYPDQH